ncbi:unnamed protein product, partial [Nesidiocoris tenuis]
MNLVNLAVNGKSPYPVKSVPGKVRTSKSPNSEKSLSRLQSGFGRPPQRENSADARAYKAAADES